MKPLPLESDLSTLSSLLALDIPASALPYEFLWKGIYELEVVRQGESILLVGVLLYPAEDEGIIRNVTRKRMEAFSRPSVYLSHQKDLNRLILWTELPQGSDQSTQARYLSDLLTEMDHLRPALPTL